MTLIFATSNPHKLSEVRAIAESKVNILSLQEAGFEDVVLEETSDTIEGNAQQKSRILFEAAKKECFAEDTGLEVDALQGAPGVYTARYAGENPEPGENIQKLLTELQGISGRKARFITVIALILQNTMYCFEGIVEGTIADRPSGSGGFGYDPVFIPDGYTQTFAELSPEIKNTLSHRARALNKMLAFLEEAAQI